MEAVVGTDQLTLCSTSQEQEAWSGEQDTELLIWPLFPGQILASHVSVHLPFTP